MEYEQLRDAIDGLSAYDHGAVSSGVRDESLRQRVIDHVRTLLPNEHRALLSKLTIDLCLSSEAVAQGYGTEDARELINWFDDQGILLTTP